MDAYHKKIELFGDLSQKAAELEPEIVVRRIHFEDTEKACEALEKGLNIQWQGCDSEVQRHQTSEMENKPDGEDQDDKEEELLAQNPVQCLEREENFIKSSLKDLGGLFCSFDE